ncbi:hypothetical protein ACE15N_20665 [Xanthomonas campestris pv. passiflorae]|uniref:hypothetical protein n=1 Tax=Xanthomonas campestris TaxID=339 RepID=UPI0024223E80|nr:hypothetical protein [Xanthomonas campestris]MBV6814085.1 hypothetical protein [Xanthomonas campestris pv. passiflorae]
MLFVILMSEYDFFSYDIFDAGGFGMTVFYATAELMIVVSGLALFEFVIPLASGMKNRKIPWSELGFFILLNTFCGLLLITLSLSRGWEMERHFLPIIISGLAALYIAAALHAPRKLKIRAAIGMIATLIAFAVIYPKPMVNLLANGLRAYGVGGELPVQIVYQNGETTRGKLIFLSPENAYITPIKDGASLSTVRRSATREIIIVRNRSL